jgi:hypothetical protein
MRHPSDLTPADRHDRLARSCVKSVLSVSTRTGQDVPDPARVAAVADRTAAVEALAAAHGIDLDDPAVLDGVLLAVAVTSGVDDLKAACGALVETVAVRFDVDVLAGGPS